LCEIYGHQYFNTGPFPPEAQGKGFLTVGEALFLKDSRAWVREDGSMERPTQDEVIRDIKLAAVAVAFDQLDYAIGICRRMEMSKVVSLDRLAEVSGVEYIRLLRDLCRAADSASSTHQPIREPREGEPRLSKMSRGRVLLKAILPIMGLLIWRIARKLPGMNNAGIPWLHFPATSQILRRYGFDELAVKLAIRSANIPFISGGLGVDYLELMMTVLTGFF
jgi:hypothetical protein